MRKDKKDRFLSTILDSIADGVFTVDKDWHITSFNKAAQQITGVSRESAIGQRCSDVFQASICQTACALKKNNGYGSADHRPAHRCAQQPGPENTSQH